MATGPSFTIGLEEEYLLVDRETRDVVGAPPPQILEQCRELEGDNCVEPELLRIGPYQGPPGCVEIPFDQGVCGAAAAQQLSAEEIAGGLATYRGVRRRLVLIAGGTQINDELARACGMDAGFGRGTTGRQVASFLVTRLRELKA